MQIIFKSYLFQTIDETQTDITTPGQKRPGSNGIEGVFHIRQISKTRVSLSDAVYRHTQASSFLCEEGVLPNCGGG